MLIFCMQWQKKNLNKLKRYLYQLLSTFMLEFAEKKTTKMYLFQMTILNYEIKLNFFQLELIEDILMQRHLTSS